MCRFLLQQPLSLSLFGISVAMWKMAAKTGFYLEFTIDWIEGRFKKRNAFPVACVPLTLHDVVVPAVGELSIISVLVEPSKKDLVRVAVLQVD